ncbi:hypothetical protein P3X46_006213 [Hevea brasiliensis]|uniref:S-protein homolog n=1 Tax=Hevea brasiliensis TaxID=3981 RepID=A0ABQ9MRD6_HEVBR|nr:hypothetical protein P3X46_006213 [Hevea brasiliensis]
MMRPLSNQLALLLVLALIASEPWPCHAVKGIFPKYHVHIVNNLTNNILNLHCKSKDDDLGPHALPVNTEFHFSFRVNLFGTTLFWCNFNWGNGRGGGYKVFWYGKGLARKCNYKNCIWSARDDAIYLMNFFANKYEKYYDWQY